MDGLARELELVAVAVAVAELDLDHGLDRDLELEAVELEPVELEPVELEVVEVAGLQLRRSTSPGRIGNGASIPKGSVVRVDHLVRTFEKYGRSVVGFWSAGFG